MKKLALAISFALVIVGQLWAQKYDKFARDRAEEMLAQISGDVHKHYFDPKFHGLDWDAKTMETKQRIEQCTFTCVGLSENIYKT